MLGKKEWLRSVTYLHVHACAHVGFALGNQKAVDVNLSYPTGQNYSLELMFTKFATAKNREKLNLLTFSSPGAICLKTSLEKGVMVKKVHSEWDSNMQPPYYKACHTSEALSLSYKAN